jgi:hypothetical protein
MYQRARFQRQLRYQIPDIKDLLIDLIPLNDKPGAGGAVLS